jgi:glycerol kinase
MGELVLALDLGTTGNRAIAFDANCRPAAQAYSEFTQHFPQPGWVEHDTIPRRSGRASWSASAG